MAIPRLRIARAVCTTTGCLIRETTGIESLARPPSGFGWPCTYSNSRWGAAPFGRGHSGRQNDRIRSFGRPERPDPRRQGVVAIESCVYTANFLRCSRRAAPLPLTHELRHSQTTQRGFLALLRTEPDLHPAESCRQPKSVHGALASVAVVIRVPRFEDFVSFLACRCPHTAWGLLDRYACRTAG
jgi:hypothetical protein